MVVEAAVVVVVEAAVVVVVVPPPPDVVVVVVGAAVVVVVVIQSPIESINPSFPICIVFPLLGADTSLKNLSFPCSNVVKELLV